MAGTMTLLQLRTAARQRADMVTGTFVSDAEFNSYINQSLYELYDLLIENYGDDYYVHAPYTITTDGTNYLYALPSDFYKLLGVDLLINGTTSLYTPIKRFSFGARESNYFSGGIPQSGQQVRLWYVPRMTELSSDSDTADGVNGWLEYVIVDAAIKALAKEESDVSVLGAQKLMLKTRIEGMSLNRDAGNPQTVVDTTSQGRGWPYGIAYVAAVNNLRYRLNGSNIWLENGSLDAFGGM